MIEDELETANSDKSGDESKTTDSVRMFDSETPNQLKAKRKKGQQKKRQHRDNKGARKGARADKPTERVEARRIERVDEHERGVNLVETGAKNRKSGENLKLILRRTVEIQAQHSPDRLHKPRTESVRTSTTHI